MLDGRLCAAQLHTETSERVKALSARGIQPGLVFVRVGEDPASRAYVGMKEKTAAQLGISSQTLVLPESTQESDLLQRIQALNADPAVHGILVQAPLPPHIREEIVFSTVDPGKDVDGFHPVNVGRLLLGDPDGFRPCTPAGIQELLVRNDVPLSGSEVVILGRGNIVGKPMAAILCQKHEHANATVTLCHSRSRDAAAHCRKADVIIAAMGVAEWLQPHMVRPGAVVVDVGVNRVKDPSHPKGYRLVGDVAFDPLLGIASKITPNPGGVGPMTIAMLMRNTVKAAEDWTR